MARISDFAANLDDRSTELPQMLRGFQGTVNQSPEIRVE
jgi:hypothetical protein